MNLAAKTIPITVHVPVPELMEAIEPELVDVIRAYAVEKPVLVRRRPLDRAVDHAIRKVASALKRLENASGPTSEYKARIDLVAACSGLRTAYHDFNAMGSKGAKS